MTDCPVTFSAGDYEMTQHYNKDDSKMYIRVKLTDSAYRAIEEYQHYSNTNHFTNEQNPKMKMTGNTGIISIPTIGNEAGVNFGFSLDAVQESMEAIQQTVEDLNSLGPITHSMRIHANEDVFAETRTKMAMSERSKGTKVIKPNKNEIGRKVKKPVSTLSSQHVAHHQDRNKACPELPALGVTEMSKVVLNVKTNETDFVRPVNKPVNVDTRFEHNKRGSTSSKHNGKSSHKHDSKGNTLSSLPLLTSPSKPSFTLTNGSHRERNIASDILTSLPLLATPSKPSSQQTNENVISSNKESAGLTAPDFVRSLTKPRDIDTRSDHKRHSRTASKGNGKSSHPRDSINNTLPSLPLLTTSSKPSSTLTNGNHRESNIASNHLPSLPLLTTSSQPSSSLLNGTSVVKKNDKEVKSQHPTSAKAKSAQRKAVDKKSGKKSTAKGKQPDITRCKIKERLIQMLAVKPYKKLELYTRLQNEGLRDAERQAISIILREIAFLRDNAFNLRRHIWNIVKEDWPFYNEEELQQLKENKPKDLTPPISSDAASPPLLSSPSPPQVTPNTDFNYGNSLKRPGEVYQNPVPFKKQRISHVKTKERVGKHMSPTSENALVYNINTEAVVANKVFNGTEITANQNNCENTSGASDQHLPTESKSAKYSAPLTGRHPTERVAEDRKTSGKSKSRNSKKSSATEAVEQPAEIVSTDKRSSSSKRRSSKPKGSTRSDAVGTDTQNKEHSAAAVAVNQPADNVSGHKKSSNSRNKADKTKKSSTSVSENQSVISADKSSNKNRSSNSKNSKESNTFSTHTAKPQEGSRSKPSTNKETRQKTKCNNKVDLPASSRKQTSKPQMTVPPFTNHKLETPKEVEQQSTRIVKPQQQITLHEPVAHHSNSNKSFEARKHREQQSSQHILPQQRLQQQYTSQEPAACRSDTFNAHNHVEQASFRHVEPQQEVQQQIRCEEPVAQPSIVSDAHTAEPQSRFDFSAYTPITCVEQRRLYKAEFESHFEEYDQLSKSVEQVRRDFHILVQQLEQLPPDSPIYQHIQQQIEMEYERLNSVEQKQRKLRFDYLQAKLAYITQLVNDYDQKLKAESAAIDAAVLQHQLLQQQQQMLPITPIEEPKEIYAYAMNSCTQVLTAPAHSNNGHIPVSMKTDIENEVEVAPQPTPQVSAYNIQQNTTNSVAFRGAQFIPQQQQYQEMGHRSYQTHGDNDLSDSDDSDDSSSSEEELASFQDSQFIPQQQQHQENGHRNCLKHGDNDSSDSDDSSDSSDSSNSEPSSFQRLQCITQQPQHQARRYQNFQENENELSGSDDSSDSSSSESEDSDSDNVAE